MPRLIEANFVRLVQLRLQGWPSVPAVTLLAGARHGRNPAVRRYFSDAMIARVANIEGAVGASDKTEWVVELGLKSGAAVPGKGGLAVAGPGRDAPLLGEVLGGERDAGQNEQGGKKTIHGSICRWPW